MRKIRRKREKQTKSRNRHFGGNRIQNVCSIKENTRPLRFPESRREIKRQRETMIQKKKQKGRG